MKKIGEYKPFLFENYLVLSLDKKWIEVFGEIPRFEAAIDSKGKLHIKSMTSIKSIQYTKNTQ